MSHDLVIANATVRHDPARPQHIGIARGRITAITPEPLDGGHTIDAGGQLALPAFVDAHLHLCKVDTLARAGEDALAAYAGSGMANAGDAIDIAARVKDAYDEAWIEPNARRALLEGVRHGVLHVRAFADTDSRARLEGVKPLLRLRDQLRDVVTVQVVAFPQDGVVRDPGAAAMVRDALELGADLVGGIPWIEDTDAEARQHIEAMLDLAVAFDRDVAMLTDDAPDPALRTTEMLAEAVIARGWQGRVSACHARAMATYPEPTFRRLVALCRRAGMTFVTSPHTGPVHLRATDLLAAGVPVALGQDDIADAYYPYGQHNLLEVAFLASHLLDLRSASGMATLLDMVTTHPARVLGLRDYGLEVGRAADLVVLDGSGPREVLTRHAAPRVVISRGREVARSHQGSDLLVDGGQPRAALEPVQTRSNSAKKE